MKTGMPITAVLAIGVTLAVAATAFAEGAPTREEYVATAEPICKANIDKSKQILKGARPKVKAGKLAPAGRQISRAAAQFGTSIKELEALPEPIADEARLQKWFKFLKIVQSNLSKVGDSLKQGDKVRAVHEEIRTERSSNAANNVSFVFGFRYCHLTPSQFN
jgi:hypothetical protein